MKWVFAINVYGARSKLGFESTLDQVVIQNLKWKIAIKAAIEYKKIRTLESGSDFNKKISIS